MDTLDEVLTEVLLSQTALTQRDLPIGGVCLWVADAEFGSGYVWIYVEGEEREIRSYRVPFESLQSTIAKAGRDSLI